MVEPADAAFAGLVGAGDRGVLVGAEHLSFSVCLGRCSRLDLVAVLRRMAAPGMQWRLRHTHRSVGDRARSVGADIGGRAALGRGCMAPLPRPMTRVRWPAETTGRW